MWHLNYLLGDVNVIAETDILGPIDSDASGAVDYERAMAGAEHRA